MADRSLPDQNNIHSLIVVSNADGATPVTLWADPTTHALITSGGSSGGSSTQYADGATVVTPTGNQINWNNAGTQVSTSTLKPLPIQLRNSGGTEIGTASNPLATTQVAPTGNGFSPVHYISAASTNATNVKASAGDIGGIQAYNNTATIGYLKLYDKASTPTVGTDTPIKTILIPANTSGAGTNVSFASPGISFTSGISFAITGGVADTDTAAVAANAFIINIDYK